MIDKKEKDYYLDLPDAPDFVSEPPRLTMSEYIKLCEELLPQELEKRENRKEQLIEDYEDFYL